jgi:hypothetical protein
LTLKYKFKTREEIPAELQSLDVERDGAWTLDAESVAEKSKLDEFRTTNVTLLKERDDLKKRFEGIDPEEVRKFADEKRKLEEAQQVKAGESDTAAQVSRQDQETMRTRSYTMPTGSRIEASHVAATDAGAVVTNVQAVVVSAPMPVVEREETRAKTEIGATQKDTSRELGAKLSSLKGIVWVGVAMFLFGLASMFYPPLKLLIGSVTTSAAILVGGLALIVLPTPVVGNELLILVGVAVAVGGWFLAHRHGRLQGW